ncbi:MAG: gfo/Idh/MocA family oxidoreductase [Planctomycetota bacterium]|nr:MAG: gfo/Idh/MocA family oxidoreductase [Planctomycetota bacterium]
MRICVAGLGNFGRLHALTVSRLAEARLAGIVEPRQDALAAARACFPGVPAWTSVDAALAECDAEAWIVATTTASHVDVARRLMAAGRFVLLEKPIAGSLQQAESLAPLVAADSRNLMAGHIVLFNSELAGLLDECRRRGPIAYIDCVRHRPTTTKKLFPGESPYHLTMVHDLYCVLALMNRAEPSRFAAQRRYDADGACDLALAQLAWPDGTVASLAASFLTPAGMPGDGFDRLEVFGQGWAARIQPNPRPLEVWDDRARWPAALEIRATPSGASGMLAEELRTFCRVVRGGEAPPVGAAYRDALAVLRWLDRLEAAAGGASQPQV